MNAVSEQQGVERIVAETMNALEHEYGVEGLESIGRPTIEEIAAGIKAKQPDETYNGWKNYPTWTVNLWLSNDEGLYNETTERVRIEARRDGEDNMLRVTVADMLKDWVTDDLVGDMTGETFAGTMVADLLGYSFAQVDWFELADAWLEQVNE